MVKKNLFEITFVTLLCSVSCTSKTPQNHHKNNDDTASVAEKVCMIDEETIKSMVAEDLEGKKLWCYSIEESETSPLFYEALNDDGLFLYRVCMSGRDICICMVEDENLYHITDYISGPADSLGVEYEHEGSYEIINDSTVDVVFDEWYRNYCYTNGDEMLSPIYHINCKHRYKLSGLTWVRIKSDSVVLIDRRTQAYCGEVIWEYTTHKRSRK